MSGDWKPGDVALVNGQVCIKTDGGWEHGNPRAFKYADSPTLDIRPLVVIDPEDAEQVERLADAFCHARWSHIEGSDECDPLTRTSMQAALREFATPTPPRPDEPLGLGAVVEDAEGERYIRCQLGNVAPWRAESPPSEDRPWRYFHDLNIPAAGVLSEGVPA